MARPRRHPPLEPRKLVPVHRGADPLGSLNDARAGTRRVRVAVEEPDRSAGKDAVRLRRTQGVQFPAGARDIESAEHDDDQLRLERGDFGPGPRRRVTAGGRADVSPAGGLDQLRHPMPGQVERFEPFDAHDPLTRRTGTGAQSGEPDRDLLGQRAGLPLAMKCATENADVLRDPGHGRRAEGYHERGRMEGGREPVDGPVFHRAHLAETLRHDEVRREPPQRFGFHADNRSTLLTEPSHFGVDLGAGSARIHVGRRHLRQPLHRRGVVTLVRDPHELVRGTERGHDLGGGRQQRDDAHVSGG
jgi:hypothetical protein